MDRRQLAKGLAAAAAAMGMASPAAARLPGSEPEQEQEEAAAWIMIHPGVWKATVARPEPASPVRMRLVGPSLKGLDQLPHVAAAPIAPPRGMTTARGCTLRLPLAGGEKIYGFGLQLLSLEQRGKKRIVRVNADPKGDSGDSHAPVPFYVTTRGYGVLVDTLRQAEFYCGGAHAKPTQPMVERTDALNNADLTAEREQQAEGSMLVEVPRASGVDVYLFAGPAMLDAVRRYNLFSGGGVAPPEWGLGFWYRVEQHSDHKGALALGREFRERKIPCDVLGLEPGWQTHAYSCTFVWNPERFADPQAFVHDAAAMDLHVNLWEHAFTHPSSPIFAPLLEHSGDYGVWEGLVPDFAGEQASKIFGEYHGRHFLDLGVSGFKLDECDGSDYTGGWSFPDLSRFPSGLDGEQMHAIFGLRYQHAVWQQFLDRKQPTYSLVRSSGALGAPYPFVLYSDLYDHRQFVRGVVTAGFSGLLWCPEVRDAASEEDLIRRLQTGVFSPLAMVNAWYIKNPPWKQIDRERNNRGEFAQGWQALEARCREILGWRMQLVPYLRAAFERYALDGTPPFRALVLDYPEEQALQRIDDEYMMGDRMLVAPLFAGEADRLITLPSGEWYNFWTGERVSGTNVRVLASEEKIPVFVKGGSVLPLAAVGAANASAESRELTVHVFGDGHLPFRIESAAGVELELSWDASAQAGHTQQKTDRYRIAAWRQATSG
jgi:alpha-D-xyloside xylohydrolase